MAKSVDSILNKFTSVVQELEDHAKKQARLSAFTLRFHQFLAKLKLAIEDLIGSFHREETKALEQAARLRKLLSGE